MKKVREETAKLYIALMFTFLPLYYTDNYYNILHDKRDVAVGFGIGLIAVFVIYAAIHALTRVLSRKKADSGAAVIKDGWKATGLLDLLVLAFAVAAAISTLLSEDPAAAFTGSEAWDVGSGMILLMSGVYFVISRNFSGRADVWFYVLLGTFAVLLIGVIDRLGYDILIMHDEIPLQYNIFISTIGNVNFWAAYLSMLVPLFVLAPIFFRHRLYRLFTYLFLFTAYFSCFITLTNTPFFGIGVAMIFLVYFSLKEKRWLKNLAANMILFMLAGAAARILWLGDYTPRPIDTDSVSLLLLQYRLYDVVGVLGFVILLVLFLTRGELTKLRKGLSIACIAAAAAAAVGTVVYIAGNYSLDMFNYRGSIWYFAWHGVTDGSAKDVIIGAGPGLLDYVTQEQIEKADFFVEWDYFYNTAHNDFLEYLVTMGIIGMLLRILTTVVPFVMLRRGENCRAERAAVLAALLGYFGQGLVTGPYILTYVLYMILLGIYAGYSRLSAC